MNLTASVLRLLEATRRGLPIDVPVSPELQLDARGGLEDREQFFSPGWGFAEGQERSVDVEVLAVMEDPDGRVALLWDCTDPVTGLRHRNAWFVWFAASVITRIVTTSEILPPYG